MLSGLLLLSLGTVISSPTIAVSLRTSRLTLDKLMSGMNVDTWLLHSIIS